MAYPNEEQQYQLSDDEIFFGKLTLKEVKKHIFWNLDGQSKSSDSINPNSDCNTSLHLIETHSQPNLRPIIPNSPKLLSLPGSPTLDNRKSDESFIKMENMVSNLCLLPGKEEELELNNTLEVIDYILNHGPNQNIIKTKNENDAKIENKCSQSFVSCKTSPEKGVKIEEILCSQSPIPPKICSKKCLTPRQKSPIKNSHKDSPNYYTPAKNAMMQEPDEFVTPSSVILKAKPTFKTPATANPLSQRKPSASLNKSPSRTNIYQHITSPVASYIKNCPQVPLVKDVYPKKPLPGPSSIPKLVKNPSQSKIQNKENVNLPSIAYKSAKKTKVIKLPNEEKLPQSHWAKKSTSTLLQPTVMKHESREINFENKPLMKQQNDSFSNLSCLQAEVSVCTQKTAFKTKKH